MRDCPDAELPLQGIVVVDFSQFLSGPLCSLRLADLGARVIKIERPNSGDACRHLYISDVDIGGVNSLFQAINRNKESFVADLRDAADCARLRQLVAHADVMLQNFRPGVIERRGFGYEQVSALNPRLVYGSITGYGDDGPWRDLPGQDLLAQARSGLLWLTGSANDPPMPMGLAAADMLAGNALAQGVLAALVRRAVSNRGTKVDTSLLETLLDFQFEVLTTYLNDGHRPPQRAQVNGAHAYLGAPYGIYRTSDGFLAIAMTPSLRKLAQLLEITGLEQYYDAPEQLIPCRDKINAVLSEHIKKRTTAQWLAVLQPADIWCSEVLDWEALLASEAFTALDFTHKISTSAGLELNALRSPLRFAGQALRSKQAAPELGEHTAALISEFNLNDN